MANLPYSPRRLVWLGDSRESLTSFPIEAKRRLGFGLRQVQNGETPVFAKVLASFGSGVYELRGDTDRTTHRVAYAVKMRRGVYVLDAFTKKSKSGKAIPREIVARIEERLKQARKLDLEEPE